MSISLLHLLPTLIAKLIVSSDNCICQVLGWQSQQVLIIYFAEIKCTLSETNLHTPPLSGECTTSATNWGEECKIKCKSGYALGTAIVTGNKHHLKCQGTTVANGAWKQRDSTSDDPPTCQSKFLRVHCAML